MSQMLRFQAAHKSSACFSTQKIHCHRGDYLSSPPFSFSYRFLTLTSLLFVWERHTCLQYGFLLLKLDCRFVLSWTLNWVVREKSCSLYYCPTALCTSFWFCWAGLPASHWPVAVVRPPAVFGAVLRGCCVHMFPTHSCPRLHSQTCKSSGSCLLSGRCILCSGGRAQSSCRGSQVCYFGLGSLWGDEALRGYCHCLNVAWCRLCVFVALSSGFVPENLSCCPLCESGFGVLDSARRPCGAALTRRAEADRFPGASAGFPATPPALKRKDWKSERQRVGVRGLRGFRTPLFTYRQ